MKLRQKLAIVMASAMVVTAVPVVTMAASDAKISKYITVSNEDPLGSQAPYLEITLKDDITSQQQFYIKLTDAKFNKVKNAAGEEVFEGLVDSKGLTKVDITSETEATIIFTKDAFKDDTIKILLDTVKVTGEAKLTIDGNEIGISDKKDISFAKKSENKAAVTVADTTKFYTTKKTGEKLGKIVITEGVKQTLRSDDDKNRTITIELDHDDYEFVEDFKDVKVVGSKAFAGYNDIADITYIEDDGEVVDIEIVLPKLDDAKYNKGIGVFTIEGLKVKSTEKDPNVGDLELIVAGKGDTKVEEKTVTAATVVEFGTDLKVDEKDEVKSGKKTKVKLTYAEVTADSTATGDVEFILDKGFFMRDSLDSALKDISWEPIYQEDKRNEEDLKERDKWIIGFVMTCDASKDEAVKFIDDKEFEIETTLDMEGEITLSTSGRYVEDQEVVVANVTPNITLDGDAMRLKVGQTKQVGGKVVISEVEKGAFARNKEIKINTVSDDGIEVTGLPKSSVDGTVEVKVSGEAKNSTVIVDVKRASKEEPSAITLEDFEVTVDRTVPQGAYDLKISVEDYRGELTLKEFFLIGTLNEEDIMNNGLPVGEASFTIGSKDYTVNDQTATMDAAAYIQDPGYTMVPVRYVATAFGVKANDILFSAGKATIFAGSRTIQLTAGSNTAIVNGVPIEMATKVVIKEGRTYAPVGEIAKLLGISSEWKADTKTAVFTNKAK